MFRKKNIDVRKVKEKALTLVRKGKLKDAVEQYELLRKHDKKEVQYIHKAAELYARIGDKTAAIAAYEQAADQYAEKGHLPKAIAVAKLILQLDPDHEATQKRLADLYAEKGEAKAAVLPGIPPPARAAPAASAEEPQREEATEASEGAASVDSPILRELPRVPLFSDLHTDEFRRLIDYIVLRGFEKDETIIAEGDQGDSFFILTQGSAIVSKEDHAGLTVELAQLNEGEFFGEFAYLSECERTASVIAAEETQVLEVTRPAMDELIAEHPRVSQAVTELYRSRVLDTLLRISPLFERFSEEEKTTLIGRFEPAVFADGEAIITEGEPSRGLFILKRGKASIQGEEKELATLGPGEFFGEMSLLTGQPTNATVSADGEVEAFRLAPDRFEEVASAHPELVRIMNAFAVERRMRNEQVAKEKLV